MPTQTTVVTRSGPVYTEDLSSTGVLAYKGIPYAAPPTGNLRWRAPQQTRPWTEPLNVSSFGPACPQFLSPEENPMALPQSEDCLKLNIWTAEAAVAEAPRPVMVWIHGGGFQFDSAASPMYHGQRFAEKGAVFVSFNYRLGTLGFLAHPDLDAEDPQKRTSGNFGLQDMICALRWVRENIEAFGGDGSNVLVFGESAGAHAVGLLMASPLAQGLFDKAIIQSGAFWDSEHGGLSTFEEARMRGVGWAAKTLRDTSDGIDAGSSLDRLRKLPTNVIVNSSLWSFVSDPGITAFSPSIDGYVISQPPGAVFAAGQQANIPLLAGWNLNEDSLFRARALPHSSADEFTDAVLRQFQMQDQKDGEMAQTLKTLYPFKTQEQAEASSYALIGDLVISEQTWEAIDLHSSTRGNNASTYAFHYTYTSAYSPIAGHASDIVFALGTLNNVTQMGGVTASDADCTFSDSMMAYWLNFARTGDPNCPNGTLVRWPRYLARSGNGSQTASEGVRQLLELGEDIQTLSNFDFSRFEFIRGFRKHGNLPQQWRRL